MVENIPLAEQINAVARVVNVRRKTYESGRSFVADVIADPALRAETQSAVDRDNAALEAALATLRGVASSENGGANG